MVKTKVTSWRSGLYLLCSTSTVRSLASCGAMPGRALAAKAGLLSTRSARLVLARSVTTTRAPDAAQSFLSVHRTCVRGSNRLKQTAGKACSVSWLIETRVLYLEARPAADAAAVQRGPGRGEEAGVEGRGRSAVPARTACHNNNR
jgi:hypothetical protein